MGVAKWRDKLHLNSPIQFHLHCRDHLYLHLQLLRAQKVGLSTLTNRVCYEEHLYVLRSFYQLLLRMLDFYLCQNFALGLH